MKVRMLKRAARVLLILNIVLLFCTGCEKEKNEELQILELEEKAEQSVDEKSADPNGHTEKSEDTEKEQNSIFVYVCGAVNAPGVYELPGDARVYEAIACAGGVREDAAEEYINQAQIVADGERIYIPTKEEAEQGTVESVLTQPDGGNAEEKVNINTASRDELKTLSGIGDSKADSIIQYRETHGAFRNIEELMNVEGIKEGVFNKIKDRITVNAGS